MPENFPKFLVALVGLSPHEDGLDDVVCPDVFEEMDDLKGQGMSTEFSWTLNSSGSTSTTSHSSRAQISSFEERMLT